MRLETAVMRVATGTVGGSAVMRVVAGAIGGP